jgi:hypothetical protein
VISNWTFDASGRELTIHATVKKVGGSCSILWIVTNRTGGMVDSGATSRLSPEGALIHLRTLARTFGIEGADVADLRAVDPRQQGS